MYLQQTVTIPLTLTVTTGPLQIKFVSLLYNKHFFLRRFFVWDFCQS